MIGQDFDIPKHFLPVNHRFDTIPDAATAKTYRGVASHVNFRPKQKWDIGPAFDWAAIGG